MSIHQEVVIAAKPDAVFEVLTNSAKFAEMTGGRRARISTQEGGAVSLFGGDIAARNVELVPGRRIVQAWRTQRWPAGVYSLVRFELEEDGDSTKLTFDQVGHPAEDQQMLDGGWHQMYWQPMNALFAGGQATTGSTA